jgi:hypothetical protein
MRNAKQDNVFTLRKIAVTQKKKILPTFKSGTVYLISYRDTVRVGERTRRMRVAMKNDSQCSELNNHASTRYCAHEGKLPHTLVIIFVLFSACSMQKGFVAEHCACSASCEIGKNEGSCVAPMHGTLLSCQG